MTYREPIERDDAVHCEVCDLPHQKGVTVCEECGHRLGTTPDWGDLEAELPNLRFAIGTAVAILVAMIAINIALFGGRGYVMVVAPVGWGMVKLHRYITLSGRLKRREKAQRSAED